jgi:pimeloyl-ACP methyl ester carboxylesterase
MTTSRRLFQIRNRSGRLLAAVLHPAGRSRKLVILAHGFSGSKMESKRLFVTTAQSLARAGIPALRFDFMGSGDSEGEFYEMTPNTEIDDLKAVIAWARRSGYREIGLLGLSFGGAVCICTTAQLPASTIRALVTWSSVPSFRSWRNEDPKTTPALVSDPAYVVGRAFFTDRPTVDVPEAYLTLTLPKLQVQGDRDLPGFREQFSAYFPKAPGVKKHLVIPGADHTFNEWPHRRKAIGATVRWFERYL